MRKLLNFKKLKNGNLKITFTREGRAEAREALADGKNDFEVFADLIEYQICNGWEYIRPEEVGALTDATIISDDCERDDHGDLVKCGRVYSNIDYYQIEGDVERLLRNKELIWKGVE